MNFKTCNRISAYFREICDIYKIDERYDEKIIITLMKNVKCKYLFLVTMTLVMMLDMTMKSMMTILNGKQAYIETCLFRYVRYFN